jgi:hypothetical protein
MPPKWSLHSAPESPKLFHLNCTITKGKHRFLASVLQNRDTFDIYMPKESAGSPLLLKNKNRQQVSKFLTSMNYPELPGSLEFESSI